MGFMSLVSDHFAAYRVETTHGACIVPLDLVGENVTDASELADYCEGEPQSFERIEGYFARYSADGYLDCTEWVGPFGTEREAIDACRDLYGTEEDSWS